jgi:hypothetical protein
MNESQMRGYRKLAGSISATGSYCVLDNLDRLVMGWLSKERAEEYRSLQEDWNVKTMTEWNEAKRGRQ